MDRDVLKSNYYVNLRKHFYEYTCANILAIGEPQGRHKEGLKMKVLTLNGNTAKFISNWKMF